jgi:hypothetical protein
MSVMRNVLTPCYLRVQVQLYGNAGAGVTSTAATIGAEVRYTDGSTGTVPASMLSTIAESKDGSQVILVADGVYNTDEGSASDIDPDDSGIDYAEFYCTHVAFTVTSGSVTFSLVPVSGFGETNKAKLGKPKPRHPGVLVVNPPSAPLEVKEDSNQGLAEQLSKLLEQQRLLKNQEKDEWFDSYEEKESPSVRQQSSLPPLSVAARAARPQSAPRQ